MALPFLTLQVRDLVSLAKVVWLFEVLNLSLMVLASRCGSLDVTSVLSLLIRDLVLSVVACPTTEARQLESRKWRPFVLFRACMHAHNFCHLIVQCSRSRLIPNSGTICHSVFITVSNAPQLRFALPRLATLSLFIYFSNPTMSCKF